MSNHIRELAQKVMANEDVKRTPKYFHEEVRKYGRHTYLRVIETATRMHKDEIQAGADPVEVFMLINQTAKKLFEDETYMLGLRLEDEIGL